MSVPRLGPKSGSTTPRVRKRGCGPTTGTGWLSGVETRGEFSVVYGKEGAVNSYLSRNRIFVTPRGMGRGPMTPGEKFLSFPSPSKTFCVLVNFWCDLTHKG